MTPSRRWFAFRLRTVFVVVVLLSLPLAWVAYSLNWIRERHFVLIHKDGAAMEMKPGLWLADKPNGPNSSPGGLWLFGEKGILMITLYPEEPDAEVDRVKKLFPEADVSRYPLDQSHRGKQGPFSFQKP
jgi:hypothetical protein